MPEIMCYSTTDVICRRLWYFFMSWSHKHVFSQVFQNVAFLVRPIFKLPNTVAFIRMWNCHRCTTVQICSACQPPHSQCSLLCHHPFQPTVGSGTLKMCVVLCNQLRKGHKLGSNLIQFKLTFNLPAQRYCIPTLRRMLAITGCAFGDVNLLVTGKWRGIFFKN